ncbi:MAG: dephospho-CoA kinase [Helicobacter sp.]|nr:dephospho-CoA kinase [Helicobacter sp.]
MNDSKHYLAPRGVERRLKTRFSAALSRNFRECWQFTCRHDSKRESRLRFQHGSAATKDAERGVLATLGSVGNSLADTTAKAKGFCNLKYGIALTGGIATGKSTAAALLKELGYDIIDADTIAHDVLEQHAARVIAVFGRAICDADSNIDRKKLGAIVFADPEKLRILESIVHPIIAQTIRDKAALLEQRQKPFFVDIPIYFEKRALFAFVSKSVLVYAPPDVQLARLRARNNLSLDEAQQRIAAQIPIDSKRQQADDIIDNSGDVEALKIQVERYLERLRSGHGL